MSRLTQLLRLSSLKLTVILLVLLVLLLLVTGIVSIQANPQLYAAIKAKFLREEVSSMDAINQDNQVMVKLNIIKKDEALADNFFNRLGVKRDDVQEISFDFDEQTKNQLNNFLPVHLNLVFADKKVSISSPTFISISASLGVKEYNFASDSASLHYKKSLSSNNSNIYFLEVREPDLVVANATNTGQLYLAQNLKPLMPYLAKVATIKLEVNGKDVQGEMTLK